MSRSESAIVGGGGGGHRRLSNGGGGGAPLHQVTWEHKKVNNTLI
jgi:hypothetical protein